MHINYFDSSILLFKCHILENIYKKLCLIHIYNTLICKLYKHCIEHF